MPRESGLPPIIERTKQSIKQEKKIGTSRRNFLATTVKAALLAAFAEVVGRANPRTGQDILGIDEGNLRKILEVEAKQPEISFIIDYASSPELTGKLIKEFVGQVAPEASDIIHRAKGFPLVLETSDQLASAFRGLEQAVRTVEVAPDDIKKLSNLMQPLVEAVVNEMLDVAGNHGQFVQQELDSTYQDLNGAQGLAHRGELPIHPLQGYISGIQLFLNETGTLGARFRFDAEQMTDTLKKVLSQEKYRQVPKVIITSFNFGEVEASIDFFQPFQHNEDFVPVEGNGKYYTFAPDDFFDAATKILVARQPFIDQFGEDGLTSSFYLNPSTATLEIDISHEQAGEKRTHFSFSALEVNQDFLPAGKALDSLNQEELIAVANSTVADRLQRQLSQFSAKNDINKVRLVFEQLINAGYITPTDSLHYSDAIKYKEPYSTEKTVENFDGYRKFCAGLRDQDTLVIHAGGNSSDLRSIPLDNFPDNGIVVSSVNAADKKKFGRNGNISCLGSELYLLTQDFVKTDPQYAPFPTSSAVAIVSAYSQTLAEKGLSALEVKRTLFQLCTDEVSIKHNIDLDVEGARVLKPEKLAKVLAMTKKEIQRSINTF